MTFKDWWTNENNPKLPQSEYLYNTRHIIVLVSVLLACIVLTCIFYKRSEKTKNILFKVIASILLFFEILSRVVDLIIAETYTWQSVLETLLPLHLCSVMVWVVIVALFTKNQMLINFGVIGGLLATLAFLLYPAVGLNRTYVSFTCFYSIFSHSLGFVTAILLMTLKRVRFEFKTMWQTILCFVVMFSWGALANWVIFPGSDYMYMRNDPLELKLNFPYQILYVAILLVYIFLFYLVYEIIVRLKRKKNTA